MSPSASSSGPLRGARAGQFQIAIVALVGTFLVLAVGALRVAAPLLVPIAVAWLLSQLFAPMVRGLCRFRIRPPIAAAIAVFGFTTITLAGVVLLAPPAAARGARAPETPARGERKGRNLIQPIQRLERAAQKVEAATGGGAAQTVAVQKPGMVQRLSGTTASMTGAGLSVIFLTYFLLAYAPLFRSKLADLLPKRVERAKVEGALQEIEVQMSRYLLLNTVVSVMVGLATWLVLLAIGMPNAALWAVLAGVLNFIPYLGAVVTIIVIGLAALVSFDTLREPMLAVGGFAVINMLEGNLLTPLLLGAKLPLNPVALFVGFLFWSWVWGIPGAILAVPMTVLIKVACDRIEATRSFALLLDN